jgi:hypothetical protein
MGRLAFSLKLLRLSNLVPTVTIAEQRVVIGIGDRHGVIARKMFDRHELHRAGEWLDSQVLRHYPTSPYAKVRRLLGEALSAAGTPSAGDRVLHRIAEAQEILARRWPRS